MAVAVAHLRNSLRRPSSRASWSDIAEWYTRYRDSLRWYLSQRTGSAADADDLVQEAFLHLWFALSSGPIHNPKAFLFTTVSNLLADQFRRAHVRATRTAVQAEEADIPDWVSEPSRAAEAEQALAQILQTLRELRPATRDVFLLGRVYLRSHADIAARIGITVSMVEKHMDCAMTAFEESGFEQPRHCYRTQRKLRSRTRRTS